MTQTAAASEGPVAEGVSDQVKGDGNSSQQSTHPYGLRKRKRNVPQPFVNMAPKNTRKENDPEYLPGLPDKKHRKLLLTDNE